MKSSLFLLLALVSLSALAVVVPKKAKLSNRCRDAIIRSVTKNHENVCGEPQVSEKRSNAIYVTVSETYGERARFFKDEHCKREDVGDGLPLALIITKQKPDGSCTIERRLDLGI
jgi:hypothetical protein